MDRLIVVSSDSHAGVPQELWPEYLDPQYHHLLPQLREDNQVYPTVIWVLSAPTMTDPEHNEIHRTRGYEGLFDASVRAAEMDREGIAAELVYHGDFRLGDMFHNVTSREYPRDVWAAGARGWNRWAADNFGGDPDRFLLVGAVGPCDDMDVTLADLEWIADHGFVGTYCPGFVHHADLPPLSHESWEPYWSACEEHNVAVVVHAGYGLEHGEVFLDIEQIYRSVAEAAGSTDLEEMKKHPEAINSKFFGNLFSDVRPRRPLWQLMLGGVFDRHPDLKLMLTEVRADWIPAALAHLDAIYDAHRDCFPAERRPSEYWHRNCMAGVSFIHRAEVEHRHEIGVETMSFGRDYPHPESTWPHTREWMRDAFAGLPVDEVAAILGENVIRFLDLDHARLQVIADRVGPTVDEIVRSPAVPAELVEVFANRSGYLKPWEGDTKLDLVDNLLRDDLAPAGVQV